MLVYICQAILGTAYLVCVHVEKSLCRGEVEGRSTEVWDYLQYRRLVWVVMFM